MTSTPQEREIRRLRKRLRQSKVAIPGVLASGIIFGGTVFLFDLFFDIHWLLYALVLWVVPFGLVLDGINIWYITHKLAKIRRNDS